jgi:hypothetical protein
MIAALVLASSIIFFLQFFVPYCRSLIAASSHHVLSPEVQDVTALTTPASGEDFPRMVQLLLLCPDRPEDRGEIRAIGVYFGMLNFLKAITRSFAPAVRTWTERECGRCTYFAAVALDRRVAFSRDLLAQQIEA